MVGIVAEACMVDEDISQALAGYPSMDGLIYLVRSDKQKYKHLLLHFSNALSAEELKIRVAKIPFS